MTPEPGKFPFHTLHNNGVHSSIFIGYPDIFKKKIFSLIILIEGNFISKISILSPGQVNFNGDVVLTHSDKHEAWK
jgi:hypothetical protein